jgi:amino acid adenylation domain-containing protein
MQAERSPKTIALASVDETLTYADLNSRANRLAHRLRALGVGPDVLVGLCVGRSADMVVGLLAVLKAGGAYVPLDPAYPAERLAFMLEDARLSVLLTHEAVHGRLPSTAATVISLDRDREAIDQELDTNLPDGAGLSDLAYVIYTSGSTGRPKGAMIHHGGLANYLAWASRAYSVVEGQGAPVHSSISFDLTVTAVLAPLIVGRRVDLLDEDLGIEQLSEALRHNGDYSLVKITPAHLVWLGDQLDPGSAAGRTRAFVIGGEQLTSEHIAFWQRHAPETELINEYGPTETVVGCCIYRVPRDQLISGPIPIGRPIANTRLYVVDRYLEPVPVGAQGELYIGGAGVARGYLNGPGLTAERFIPDPFGGEPGGRLYRTGDLARWRPDGNLEYLGRVDRQIKVRGYRIEPAEIEEALGRHTMVRDAVVVPREDVPGDRRLVAYLVAVAGQPVPVEAELRRFLRSSLPEPMIPAAYVVLQSLPLTPNGKVDREALPTPGRASTEQDGVFIAPRGQVEQAVASIWETVLGRERVGVLDNFFEIGGHSLLATQVVSRLRGRFGVEIPVRALFEAPTVAGLAAQIEQAKSGGARHDAIAIDRVARTGPLPLSFSQEALWFLDQLAPGRPTFNVHAALRVTGPLDPSALERSLDQMARRHESLRTSFVANGGTPYQVITAGLHLALDVTDLRSLPTGDREAEARRRAIEESRRPFDLAQGPLVRVGLLRLADAEHVILLTMHHLITDGWSFSLAAGELAALYAADRLSQSASLAPLPIQYADFARWQRSQLQGGAWQTAVEYWIHRLSGVPPLELPTDRARPPVRSARGELVPLSLSPELSEAVRALCRREAITPFMALLSAFQLVLGRWSGQEDFAVGAPVANRTLPETERLLGYFVNMLALRADLTGNPTVREFLARVRGAALEAFEHQEIPLEVLIPALAPSRDASRSPLFQVMFVFQNNAMPDVGALDVILSPFDADQGTGTAKFDLALGFGDSPQGFVGSLEFNSDLFDRATIDRFSQHYVKILADLTGHADRRLSSLSLLSDADRRQVDAWSHTPAQCTQPSDRIDRGESCTIHGAFEAQVRATPHAPALVADEERLTYAELNVRANRLAHELRARGIGPEDRVGLVLDGPGNRMVAVLGVLKAGGAYVPLEPSLPRERTEAMLDAARVSLVIVDGGVLGRPPRISAATLDLNAAKSSLVEGRSENPGVLVGRENLAYVVFTSGTTGRPKGVMVAHQSLLAIRTAWEQEYNLRTPPLRHLQAAGFGFDVFSGDWVRALTTGGTLVACPRQVVLDPPALAALIRRERIECLELVPALAEALAAHLERRGGSLEGVRLLAVGSDTLRCGLYRRLCRLVGSDGRVVNSYGLTEATIDSTYFGGPPEELDGDGPVPIGRPFPGTRVYVLDGGGEPVPAGVVGELYIGGSGLARGYVSDASQTALKFVPDPHGGAGARMYATGDRARWREGGVLDLLGRRDGQVKVRGFRVELAEVESVMARHEGISDALVVVYEDSLGQKRLAAYVVPAAGASPSASDLKRWLRDRMPEPMVPSSFAFLDALPLSPNGKLDRSALPPPSSLDEDIAKTEYVAPRTAAEWVLAEITADLLGRSRVGVLDNFFEIGIDSILGIQMVSRAREGGLALDPTHLFRHPNIASLAAAVESSTDHPSSGAVATTRLATLPLALIPEGVDIETLERDLSASGGVEDVYPLTPVQEGMLFHTLADPDAGHYVEQFVCVLRGELDRAALEASWQHLVARHPALRSAIRWTDDGRPLNVVHRRVVASLVYEDRRASSASEERDDLESYLDSDARRGLDHSQPPLSRLALFRRGESAHQLVWTVHHAIIDGWCVPVLLHELLDQYEGIRRGGAPEPGPSRPFRDYVAWLLGRREERAEAYWRDALQGVTEATRLGLDSDSSNGHAGATPVAAERQIRLPAGTTAALEVLVRSRRLTLSTLVQGAWALLLSRYCGRGDVVFGITVSGRPAELEGVASMVGVFLNVLPLRVAVTEDSHLIPWLRALQTRIADLREFEAVPLSRIQSWSNVPAGATLFESLVTIQNLPFAGSLRDRAARLGIEGVRNIERAHYPIALTVLPGAELDLKISFDARRFDARAIELVLRQLGDLFAAMAENPEGRLVDFPWLPQPEQEEVLGVLTESQAEPVPAELDLERLSEEELDTLIDHLL